ncbi:MAG: L,D-transpeptidase [Syntrophobacteraceae bacterium]|jgi:lipoprotein-anchoring transpeptidase ErfK/SrfK
MLRGSNPGLWISLIVLLLIFGCAKAPVNTEQFEPINDEATVAPVAQPTLKASSPPKASVKPAGKDLATVRRVITEKEVRKLQAKDTDLEFYRCIEILCRLNKKDKEYIRADMKRKHPLTVPKNFSSYKNWSPLPGNIASAGKLPKLILLVKNIHFLGWYQNGMLVDDTYVCIGKMNTWTKKGLYSVKAKDPDHMSTYPNAYGYPAYMPNALHIYGRVWIHTGDVVGPNCSHGCINVPIAPADRLYDWTDVGTAVLITESLKDLGSDIKIARLDKLNPQKAPLVKEKGKQDNRQKSANETSKQFPGNSNKVTTGGI